MQKIFKTNICPHCGEKIVFTPYNVVNENTNPGFGPVIGEYVTNVIKCPHCKKKMRYAYPIQTRNSKLRFDKKRYLKFSERMKIVEEILGL